MARLRTVARNPLVTVGVTSVLCGVAVAVAANIPGEGVDEYQRTGRRADDPEGWLVWSALGLTLASSAWVWTLWSTRPGARAGRRRRGVASAVFAAACAAGLVVVVLRMPSPGPSGGVDLSVPLMLPAFALAAVGALVTAVDGFRRPDEAAEDEAVPRRGLRPAAGVGSLAAVPLLTAAVAVGAVPSWAVAMNTEQVTTDRPAPAASAPALTGAVAWSTPPRKDGSPGSVRTLAFGTAGGLAMLETRGLRMLDPASGARRWAFHRWDARTLGPRHRPNGSDTTSTVVSPDGRLLATTVFVDRPRTLFIDGLRADTRVWVFDTVSGRLRADFAVPDTARVVAVDDGRVTIDEQPARHEPGATERGALTAFTFEGERTWRSALDEGCRPTDVLPVGGDVLTLLSCRGGGDDDPRHRLVRLGDDGRPLWSWQVRGDDGTERFDQVKAAVTEGVAVVDAREITRTGDGAGDAEVTHDLTGIRIADGRPQWSLPGGDGTRLRSDEPTSRGALHAAAGTAVIVDDIRTGTDDEPRFATALQAVDVRTGERSWSHTVPDSEVPELNAAPGSLALLRDGRLFVAYRELNAEAKVDGCAMAVWDVTTGERHGPFQPDVPDKEWCLVQPMGAMEIPGGVAVHLRGGSGEVFVLD